MKKIYSALLATLIIASSARADMLDMVFRKGHCTGWCDNPAFVCKGGKKYKKKNVEWCNNECIHKINPAMTCELQTKHPIHKAIPGKVVVRKTGGKRHVFIQSDDNLNYIAYVPEKVMLNLHSETGMYLINMEGKPVTFTVNSSTSTVIKDKSLGKYNGTHKNAVLVSIVEPTK